MRRWGYRIDVAVGITNGAGPSRTQTKTTTKAQGTRTTDYNEVGTVSKEFQSMLAEMCPLFFWREPTDQLPEEIYAQTLRCVL